MKKKIAIEIGCDWFSMVASIALYDRFSDLKIHPVSISTCGGASVIGFLWSKGATREEMLAALLTLRELRLYNNFNLRSLFSLHSKFHKRFPAKSFYHPDIYQDFCHLLAKDIQFEDLTIPLSLYATDVFTGNAVCLNHGRIRDAIYASSAFFPLYPPVEIEGRSLVSGLFSNPVPKTNKNNIDFDEAIAIESYDPNFCKKGQRRLIERIITFYTRTFQNIEVPARRKSSQNRHYIFYKPSEDRDFFSIDPDQIPSLVEDAYRQISETF